MDLCLHYAPDNASLCVRLALEELGLPYRTALVDRRGQGQKTPAYLALNPNGLIPVLETPAGPIFETAAILLWLAEAQGRLIAPVGSDRRGHDLQWLFWLSNTLHAGLRQLFYPGQYIATDSHAALLLQTRRRLHAHLSILDGARFAPWLDDDAPSVHGCYLGPMLRWAQLYGGPRDWLRLADWPRLHSFAQGAEARPAALRLAAAEGLGPRPFTAPQPCTPPEGAAL